MRAAPILPPPSYRRPIPTRPAGGMRDVGEMRRAHRRFWNERRAALAGMAVLTLAALAIAAYGVLQP
jgi:hypothetical protein